MLFNSKENIKCSETIITISKNQCFTSLVAQVHINVLKSTTLHKCYFEQFILQNNFP
jgi:hypothetical protein